MQDYLEYLGTLIFGFIVRRLPLKFALWLGDLLGDFAFSVLHIRRKVTLDNLRAAFPEKDEQERRAIARRTYRNFLKTAIEHLRFPLLTEEKIRRLVEFEGAEHFQWAFAQGKGTLCLSGHFGNWQLMGTAIRARGYPMQFVVQEQRNKLIDAMLNRYRRKFGTTIINAAGGAREILKALRKNSFVAILADQDAGRDGLFVEFLGRKASTPKGPALLALKTGASILFGVDVRVAGGRHCAIIQPLRLDGLPGATSENVQTITQAYTAMLEQYVRLYPDQWFWMHRRWKTLPPKEEVQSRQEEPVEVVSDAE